ncbi:hypothetical protein BT96DRAFT_694915 [Gymnopus androsaceus JB14]|uniref:Uncharacterized protein n=1 Tax=Gymnopus androsaceus JB14 TaxID=1447944 RepID=A0A6A4HML5_9AGAR|nr:hypothetical protein BT96DRAFT_694915 [Gymnopus androsaceus JB14]
MQKDIVKVVDDLPMLDRSSRHRRTERDVGITKSTGRESSDEAESSDASKNKYGMSSSAYRRTKTKDPIPGTSSWTLPATMSSGQPYGSFPIPSSIKDSTPYGGPIPPSNFVPYPVPSSKAEDLSRGGFPAPSMSKPNQDSARSPEPLPVRLPGHSFRDIPPPQPPVESVDQKTSKRGERYGSKTSRNKEQEHANTFPNPSNAEEPSASSRRPFGEDKPQGPSSLLPAHPTRDKSAFGPSSTGATAAQTSSSSYPLKHRVAEPVSYEPQENLASASRNEPATSSSRHRNIQQSTTGASIPSAS